jgi:hypothetical protein
MLGEISISYVSMNGGEGGRKKKPNTHTHKYTTLSPQNTCRKKKLKKKKKNQRSNQ